MMSDESSGVLHALAARARDGWLPHPQDQGEPVWMRSADFGNVEVEPLTPAEARVIYGPVEDGEDPVSAAVAAHERETRRRQLGRTREQDEYEARYKAMVAEVDALRRSCRPATANDWAMWLRAFLLTGGEVTHHYDYPISRQDWLVLLRPPEVIPDAYGSASVNVIVPPHVGFAPGELSPGRIGHCGWYFFGGDGDTVPVVVARGSGLVPMFSDVSDLLKGAS